jgi:hypothetical protein
MDEVKNPYDLYREKYCALCTDKDCPVYGSKLLPSEQKAYIKDCAEMNRIIRTIIGD